MSNGKQAAILQVSTVFLADLFKAGSRTFRVTDSPLPDDAEIIHAHLEGDTLILKVTSSEGFPGLVGDHNVTRVLKAPTCEVVEL